MEFRCLRLLQVLCENRWHGKSQVTLCSIQYHKVKPTSVWTSIPPDQIAQSHILEFFRSGVGTSVVWSVLRKMDTQPTPPSSTIHPLHTLFRLGVCTQWRGLSMGRETPSPHYQAPAIHPLNVAIPWKPSG